VGADATFAFWDMESQTRLKKSEILDLPITKCCFNSDGRIFAYSPSVDCAMVCILITIRSNTIPHIDTKLISNIYLQL